jgi:hypothetical protein
MCSDENETKSFRNTEGSRDESPLSTVHMDTNGPMKILGIYGAVNNMKYFVTIRSNYSHDVECSALLKYFEKPSPSALVTLSTKLRSSIKRYSVDDGLLYYAVDTDEAPRIVVPNDDSLRRRPKVCPLYFVKKVKPLRK